MSETNVNIRKGISVIISIQNVGVPTLLRRFGGARKLSLCSSSSLNSGKTLSKSLTPPLL